MINIGCLPHFLGYLFLILGGFSFAIFITFICIEIQSFICNIIKNIKWRYKYKHRFDKPPIAKCYCVDCQHFGANNSCKDRNECIAHYGWRVADEWFCWDANPLEEDPE